MRGESGPGCAAPPPRKVSVCRTPLKYDVDPGKPGVAWGGRHGRCGGLTQARRGFLWFEVIEGLSRGTVEPRPPEMDRRSAEAGTLGRSRYQSRPKPSRHAGTRAGDARARGACCRGTQGARGDACWGTRDARCRSLGPCCKRGKEQALPHPHRRPRTRGLRSAQGKPVMADAGRGRACRRDARGACCGAGARGHARMRKSEPVNVTKKVLPCRFCHTLNDVVLACCPAGPTSAAAQRAA